MQQVGAQTFSSLTDMVINWAETGKLNAQDFAATFIQSVGAALLQYAAAQVAMAALSAFTAWIGVPYVGPVVAPTQAIAAAAAAGVFMTAIGSALHGQAHDGIDSVPETGTGSCRKVSALRLLKPAPNLMPLWIELQTSQQAAARFIRPQSISPSMVTLPMQLWRWSVKLQMRGRKGIPEGG